MPIKLLIATRNAGKLRELTAMLGDVPFDIVSLNDIGIDDEVEETGETFEENAALKAETYARLSGLPDLADDFSSRQVAGKAHLPGKAEAAPPANDR